MNDARSNKHQIHIRGLHVVRLSLWVVLIGPGKAVLFLWM